MIYTNLCIIFSQSIVYNLTLHSCIWRNIYLYNWFCVSYFFPQNIKCIFLLKLYNLLPILVILQEPCFAIYIRNHRNWGSMLGIGGYLAFSVGALLFLHMERCQMDRKSKICFSSIRNLNVFFCFITFSSSWYNDYWGKKRNNNKKKTGSNSWWPLGNFITTSCEYDKISSQWYTTIFDKEIWLVFFLRLMNLLHVI